MSNYNVWLTEIRLHPSRQLLVLLVAAHLGAFAVVLAMPLVGWLMAMLVLAILLSMVYAIWRFALLRGRGAVVGLRVTRDGLEMETCAGVWLPTIVLGSSFVSPWLTVLHLKLQGRRFMVPVVLLPDSLAHDAFRRLRVWLRWGNVLKSGAEDAAML